MGIIRGIIILLVKAIISAHFLSSFLSNSNFFSLFFLFSSSLITAYFIKATSFGFNLKELLIFGYVIRLEFN